MTKEELKAAVERLRERRTSIPSLRDYRPQKGSKSTIGKAEPIDLTKIFGGTIIKDDPTTEEGGEADGTG
jgi:hypothetical protein